MKKILIFDEPEVISFINGAIGDRCELVWTSKEEEVVPLLQREKPDALLIHYETTEEGFHRCESTELLEGIRAADSSVRILLMSEPKAVLDVPEFVTGGIFKPLKKDHLEDVLQRYKLL